MLQPFVLSETAQTHLCFVRSLQKQQKACRYETYARRFALLSRRSRSFFNKELTPKIIRSSADKIFVNFKAAYGSDG